MFSYVVRLKFSSWLLDPDYDVSHDVIKSAILQISNDVISVTGRPIDFLFDASLLSAASEPHVIFTRGLSI